MRSLDRFQVIGTSGIPPVLRANLSCVRTTASIVRHGFVDVPVEMQTPVFQRQSTVGGVARLREPRHDPLERIQTRKHPQAFDESSRALIGRFVADEILDKSDSHVR